jgi:hypothetical protein
MKTRIFLDDSDEVFGQIKLSISFFLNKLKCCLVLWYEVDPFFFFCGHEVFSEFAYVHV